MSPISNSLHFESPLFFFSPLVVYSLSRTSNGSYREESSSCPLQSDARLLEVWSAAYPGLSRIFCVRNPRSVSRLWVHDGESVNLGTRAQIDFVPRVITSLAWQITAKGLTAR